jgi:serine/threonine-protein kinase
LGRRVLIKALSAGILPTSPFATTLEREARLLSELQHPNILQVHDFVRRQERSWIVLEYVDGWSLRELLDERRLLEPCAALAIALEVSRALAHAHAQRIVHRDVEPNNILVSRTGIVKLANFAVAVDERLPTAPELLDGGTSISGPTYMSPEQVLGEPADPRTDLFSLGVVLYEMLSGQRPFDAEDRATTMQRIRHQPTPPLPVGVGPISPLVERTVARCLEKLQNDRFDSADELSRELAAALSQIWGEPSALSPANRLAQALTRTDREAEAKASNPGGQPSRMSDPSPARFATIWPAAGGLFAAFCLIVIGGASIQRLGGKSSHFRRVSARLELAPAQAAHLRVVADPWADVIVDGQKLETTPFARAIPLAAGTHFIRLEHPHAPAELRTVQLAPGETVLLDIRMRVGERVK